MSESKEESCTVQRCDGKAAAQREDEFRQIYAEVFAEPPCNESEDEVEATFRRFRSQTRKSTFSGVLAYTAEHEPVGLAYGYPLGANTGWWDQLTTDVPDELRREDGHRTFGLMEMAVRRAWRRQGIARRLHDALLEESRVERVLLNVHQERRDAVAAYRSWGYQQVGEMRFEEGGGTYSVMLLDLANDANLHGS